MPAGVKIYLMISLNIIFFAIRFVQKVFVFAKAATICESWKKSHEAAFDKPCYSSMDKPTIFCKLYNE